MAAVESLDEAAGGVLVVVVVALSLVAAVDGLSVEAAGAAVFAGSTIRTTLGSGRGCPGVEIGANPTARSALGNCQFPADMTAGAAAIPLAGVTAADCGCGIATGDLSEL
jgi:hypothetical protein